MKSVFRKMPKALLVVAITVIGWVQLFAKSVGIFAVAGDSQMASDYILGFIQFASSLPWPFSIAIAFGCTLISYLLLQQIFSKEVVIRSDMSIRDVRASSSVELAFDGGGCMLLKPTGNTRLQPAQVAQEGAYRLFVLFGEHVYDIHFAEPFEFVGGKDMSSEKASGTLYEYQIVVIRDGRDFRYFVHDTLAFSVAVSVLREYVDKNLKKARSAAYFHGLM
ncbi:hypothetical protein [Pseudochelatococcus contaminans]|uniref:Uncharacterized protein n=1 Tax=Pseudochelatococcus contaminans TaxID=1538103 RepID=A0A7W6EIW3_9HYPH|nr:hypothetical protein [Pseudochelatococcus contaminans]MBB3811476.1 hypothetical protein [Pseudochelatococcus contaminans]